MLINYIVTTQDELLDETYLYLVKSQNMKRATVAVEGAVGEGEAVDRVQHLSEMVDQNTEYNTLTFIGQVETGYISSFTSDKNLVFAAVVLNEKKALQELLIITAPAEAAAVVNLANYQRLVYENEITYGAVMPLSKLLVEDEVFPLAWERDPEEELIMLADAAGLTEKARGK